MPTAIGSGVINFGSAVSTSLTQALNIPATGSDRCLVVSTFLYHNFTPANTVSGVTYNGAAMTSAGSGYGTTNDTGTIQYWYLVNPTTGSSVNIVASIGGGGAVEELCIMAQGFSDVHQTTPFGTAVGTNGTNSTTSTGTVSLAGSDIALAVWSGYDGSSTVTLTPDGTGIVEIEHDQFSGTSLGFQYRANGTLGWTMSPAVDSFQQYSIPLKDVSGGASVDPGVIYNSASVLGTPFFSFG